MQEITTTYITSADGTEEIECTFFAEEGEIFCDVPMDELNYDEYMKAWREAEEAFRTYSYLRYEYADDNEDYLYEVYRERKMGWLD